MTENINNNVDLLRVKDGKMKESLERLITIHEEIISNEEKIKFQDEEMGKTQKLIDYYKEYYETQKCALDHFCNERVRLNAENIALLDVVNSFHKDNRAVGKKHTNPDSHIEKSVSKKQKLNCTNPSDNVNDLIIPNNTNGSLITIKSESILNMSQKIIDANNHMLPVIVSPKKKSDISIIDKGGQVSINVFAKKAKKRTKIKGMESKKNKLLKKMKVPKCPDSNVTLKVTTSPLNQVLSVDKRHKIHKIYITKDDSFICGNHGLLSNFNKTKVFNYQGHEDYYVYNFFVYNQTIISIAYDYILQHSLSDENNHKLISSFDCPISCTFMYKSTVYGALQNGSMFIIDLSDQRWRVCGRIFPTLPKSMVVVKYKEKLHLLLGMLNGEVMRYDLNEDRPHGHMIGKVEGLLKGILTDSKITVCYTDQRLYFIDKEKWMLSLIRETSNNISLVDVCGNSVIMIDNCNILHRYIIKKGRITAGSTIESLPIVGLISSMQVSETEKKVFVSCLSEVYSMKL